MNSSKLQAAKGHESLVRLIESACCVVVAHVVQLIHVVTTLVLSMWRPSFVFIDLDADICA
jgi:hypothetical protein